MTVRGANEACERLKRYLGAIASLYTEDRLSRIAQVAARRTRQLTLVLEDIYQPHNAAAILRSCDCFGVQDVHVIEKRNRFSAHKSTVSKGAYHWLDIYRWRKGSDPTLACIESLKRRGFLVVAATLRPQAVPIEVLPVDRKLAVLLGTEETGLSDCAHAQADVFAYVPMVGFTQSLNVSVTAAVILYTLSKRLREGTTAWSLSSLEQLGLQLRWALRSCPGAHEAIRRLLRAERALS